MHCEVGALRGLMTHDREKKREKKKSCLLHRKSHHRKKGKTERRKVPMIRTYQTTMTIKSKIILHILTHIFIETNMDYTEIIFSRLNTVLHQSNF